MSKRIKLTSAIGLNGKVRRADSELVVPEDIPEKLAKELISRGKAKDITGDEEDESDLADMTVAELKEIAQAEGVEGFANMKKADLIEALEAIEDED